MQVLSQVSDAKCFFFCSLKCSVRGGVEGCWSFPCSKEQGRLQCHELGPSLHDCLAGVGDKQGTTVRVLKGLCGSKLSIFIHTHPDVSTCTFHPLHCPCSRSEAGTSTATAPAPPPESPWGEDRQGSAVASALGAPGGSLHKRCHLPSIFLQTQ